MFIPYRVDVPFNHRPVINWLLVTSIIIAFVVIYDKDSYLYQSLVLDGWHIKEMIGHIWLHAGFFHLFGNMLFLWLFGNAVCSKIGNLLYIPVFIGLGLIASASYLIFAFDGRPVVGASGAINGIVGMYLVFFPQNAMDCFFALFFRPIFFSISGIWMVLLWFGFDILGAVWGKGNVAYISHISGFLGGVALASLLLKLKLVVMERDEKSIYDLIFKKSKVPNVSKKEIEYWKKEFKKKGSKKITPLTTASVLKESSVKKFNASKPEMDSLRFVCSCGQKIKVPKIYAGKKGRCPRCKVTINIPYE